MRPTTEEPSWVTEPDVRASLARLSLEPLDRRKGLFGPGSMYWEVNKHAIVYFLGAVQSVQLQLAHPWVAVGVFEHSKIMSNPTLRARVTYTFLWSLIYGDLPTVQRMSASLHSMHARVHGRVGQDAGRFGAETTYGANEVSALLWVHVTAFYCRVKIYEKLIRPLTDAERDRFCAEAKLYAYCFGIPEDVQPSTWQEVEDYVAAMQRSDRLARTDAGLRISRFLRDSIPFPVRGGLWSFLCLMLPERTRTVLELPEPTPGNERSSRRMERFLAFLVRWLPGRFAYVPAYHEAMRRIAGEDGPGFFTSIVYRILLGRPSLVS